MSTDGQDLRLAEAFASAAGPGFRELWPQLQVVEERLRSALGQATEAWPDFALPPQHFAEFLGQKWRPIGQGDPVAALRIPDLYLVCACVSHDETALKAFETYLFRDLPAIVRRSPFARRVSAEDVAQALRVRLLVRDPQRGDADIRLASYGGRGDLRRWFKVAALRLAENLTRRDGQEVSCEDEVIADFLHAGVDVETDYFKQVFRREFSQCFGETLAELEPRDQTLLRLYYVDGAGIDQIAAIYRIHRASASRRLTGVRESVAKGVRRRFLAKFGVGKAELGSIIRLIRSELELSFRRHLVPDQSG